MLRMFCFERDFGLIDLIGVMRSFTAARHLDIFFPPDKDVYDARNANLIIYFSVKIATNVSSV